MKYYYYFLLLLIHPSFEPLVRWCLSVLRSHVRPPKLAGGGDVS